MKLNKLKAIVNMKAIKINSNKTYLKGMKNFRPKIKSSSNS